MKTKNLFFFIGLLLLAGCRGYDKTDLSEPCDDGKKHVMTKWDDVGTGQNGLGMPAIKQIRRCTKCGRVQVEWHC